MSTTSPSALEPTPPTKPARHTLDLKGRLKAAGLHFSLSLLIAALSAALVFGLWFTWPFRIISGGQELFLLIVTVDVVLGPLLTFAVFNRAKPKTELTRDLLIIVLIQLAALAYGMYTVYLARPVGLVFEVDRLRVITHVDVKQDELPKAPAAFQTLSLTGPRLMGARESTAAERITSIEQSLQGVDIAMRPAYWVPFEDSKERLLKRTHSVDELRKKHPSRTADIDEALVKAGRQEQALRVLPVHARDMSWSALVDASTGLPVTYVPLDGFF